jgi:hypothetical protein
MTRRGAAPGLLDLPQRLLEVDDVMPALGDEPAHLRVPATGLMPEVDACLEEVLDLRGNAGGRHSGQQSFSWGWFFRRLRFAC